MFEVIDLSPKVGSEIRIDRASFVEGTHAREIERLLVERSALVFREMFLTDEEQRQFAAPRGMRRSIAPRRGSGGRRRNTAGMPWQP